MIKSKGSTKSSYHHYESIPLKTFIEIANSGELERLLIKGRFNADEAIQRWETIIAKNAEANGSFSFDKYFSLYQTYLGLVAKHTRIQAALWYISLLKDWAVIEQIREAGYKIDTTSSATYAKSIEKAFRQSQNLVTKYNTKRNELEELTGAKEGHKKEPETFDDIWASISMAVSPMIINEDIRLSQYNAIKKQIQRRNQLAAQKQAKR